MVSEIRTKLLFLCMLFCTVTASGQSVGLVLSGGGARGLSHIGVIKALEENHIPIDYIAGTSIGSIVGGLYAIGMSPEDMVAMMSTQEFHSWYTGEGEREFFSYLYSGYPTPAMFRLSMKWDEDAMKQGKRKVKLSIPTSVVSPYPMDIAFVELFANASAAADYDFDNLMLPFFCISADVTRKQSFLTESGDLGSAIRASMTFPAYFKPIVIDSVLLFDGGFYDNFPWKTMKDKYNPDVLLGVKCVRGDRNSADQDDVYKLLEAMMTTDTDYNIPEEDGLVISGTYDYSLMDFDKIDQLVQSGYDTAMLYMDRIKAMIGRRRPQEEVDSMRIAFRKRCSEVQFDSVRVTGPLTESQKKYIENTISNKDGIFSFREAKRGYYRVINTGTVQSMHPTAVRHTDSTFTLCLNTVPKNVLALSVGGNISSTSLMQGFVGVSHTHFARHPWNAAFNLDIGQFFTGGGLYFRQHVGVKPFFLYEVMLNAHRFDYFGSSQSIRFSNSLASNIRENEMYLTLNVGTPISYRSSILLELGATGGFNRYEYFPADNYTQYDRKDRTKLSYFSTRVKVAQTTLNYNMYPTSGKRRLFEVRYTFAYQKYKRGTIFPEGGNAVSAYSNVFLARANMEDYYDLCSWFSLGYNIDITVSTRFNLRDYTSTMLVMPAYLPTLHSKTLMLDAYRAPIYAGVTLFPIFKFSENIFLHLAGGYFQPYVSLVETAGGGYEYSEPFPEGGFIGNAALVWQSPIGPVSISCAYYDKAEKAKWYPSFNIGFLIFREHGLRN